MTPDEFAKTIKAKYPQYANIDNTILAQKIVDKYPVYKSKVNFNPTTKQVYKQAGDIIANQITGQGEYAGQGAIQRGVGATATAFSTIPNVLISQLPQTTQIGLSKLGSSVGSKFNWLTDKIAGTKLFSEIGNLEAQGYINPQTTPELYNVKGALATATSGGEIAGNILAADQAVKGLNKVVPKIPSAVENVTSKISDVTGNIKNKVIAPSPNDLQKIQEIISPKPTVREAKLALEQGRLYPGQKPTLLKAGTPDQIAISDQQANSARTISQQIPNAAKMDGATLYDALDTKIGEIATKLQPEMQKVPVKPETIQKIANDWATTKQTQLDNAYTPTDVNVPKLQADFEVRLQKSASGNMGDLWETRKAYDASVPENVKKANSLSSESLQAKKEIWLQNRAVLNNAINDAGNGLGQTSKQAFSDMRNMYEAQNGIMSKASVGNAQISKLNQFIKDNPKTTTTVKYVLGVLGLEKALKISGVPLP